MANIDVTSKIERLEVFEERLGVTLDRLNALFFTSTDGQNYVNVYGELQPRKGTKLQEDVQLVVAAYDSSGRVIGTSFQGYLTEKFFGLETFLIQVCLVLNPEVSKVRVYPKKW